MSATLHEVRFARAARDAAVVRARVECRRGAHALRLDEASSVGRRVLEALRVLGRAPRVRARP